MPDDKPVTDPNITLFPVQLHTQVSPFSFQVRIRQSPEHPAASLPAVRALQMEKSPEIDGKTPGRRTGWDPGQRRSLASSMGRIFDLGL